MIRFAESLLRLSGSEFSKIRREVENCISISIIDRRAFVRSPASVPVDAAGVAVAHAGVAGVARPQNHRAVHAYGLLLC